MSKIISKIKNSHEKCSQRSSSVSDDSCINDVMINYSSMGYCTLREKNIENPEVQCGNDLKRLKFYDETFKNNQRNIDADVPERSNNLWNIYRKIDRNKYYLEPPGPLDDLHLLRCDLIDSAYSYKEKHFPRFRSTFYQQFGINDNDYARKLKPFDDYQMCKHHINIYPDDSFVELKSQEAKACTSMTYFASPNRKKESFINDKISNNSDTSRQSSTSSQHIKIGINLFNVNPNYGVDYLRSNGMVLKDKDLAKLFLAKKTFNKRQLFEFLTNKKNRSIHECFCNLMDLKNKSFVEVLREYLNVSYITGEYSVMINIVDALSKSYVKQHSEGAIMGLNIDQINTIFQFLITFNANESLKKNEKKISREHFVELLQKSLTSVSPEYAINRQLALCLYLDISECPLSQPIDVNSQNLLKISKMLVEAPKNFNIMEMFRYIICHVDLFKVVSVSLNGVDKISYHERTVFLFNDCILITKKKWQYDYNIYRIQEVINLTDIHCTLLKQSLPQPATEIVQITNCQSNDLIVCLNSKLMEDLYNFYSSLEEAVIIQKAVTEYQKMCEIKTR